MVQILLKKGALLTYGETVVDEGVNGADPEDEEAPDELPGRLVPEHGLVVFEIQHDAVGRRHSGRDRAPLRVRQGQGGKGPLEREHLEVRGLESSHFETDRRSVLFSSN